LVRRSSRFTTDTKAHALPVPSVFIIDASGVIRYVYSNPDFRIRLRSMMAGTADMVAPSLDDAASDERCVAGAVYQGRKRNCLKNQSP